MSLTHRLGCGPSLHFAQESLLACSELWGSCLVLQRSPFFLLAQTPGTISLHFAISSNLQMTILLPAINFAAHFTELLEENALSSKISNPWGSRTTVNSSDKFTACRLGDLTLISRKQDGGCKTL